MYKIIYSQLLKSVKVGMSFSEKQDWPLFRDQCKVLRQENTIRINQLLLPTITAVYMVFSYDAHDAWIDVLID